MQQTCHSYFVTAGQKQTSKTLNFHCLLSSQNSDQGWWQNEEMTDMCTHKIWDPVILYLQWKGCCTLKDQLVYCTQLNRKSSLANLSRSSLQPWTYRKRKLWRMTFAHTISFYTWTSGRLCHTSEPHLGNVLSVLWEWSWTWPCPCQTIHIYSGLHIVWVCSTPQWFPVRFKNLSGNKLGD